MSMSDMDDTISRKAIREAMYHEAMEKDSNDQKWDGGCWIRYKMFERVIESLPSTQKTGKWVYNIHDIPICDRCGYMTHEYGNYCPHCGARMVGEEE